MVDESAVIVFYVLIELQAEQCIDKMVFGWRYHLKSGMEDKSIVEFAEMYTLFSFYFEHVVQWSCEACVLSWAEKLNVYMYKWNFK